MSTSTLNLIYLAAAILFVLGLKGLGHPRNALFGNLLSALGMLIAIVATLIRRGYFGIEFIAIGLVAGTIIGAVLAVTIRFTAMPQLVALFNGFGGVASLLVAGAVTYQTLAVDPQAIDLQFSIATAATGLIGAVTFVGSVVAFGKLQGVISEKPLRYRGEQIIKTLIAIAAVALGVLFIIDPVRIELYWYLSIAAAILGILLVIPIGGADMPIVITLLNSYSGLAAAATGFVLSNNVLIISGSLVGASGVILTRIMCKAMNRSLPNVLFGGVGAIIDSGPQDDLYAGKVKATSPDEVALILKGARRVVFIPGYGMAVAHAQTAVRLLMEALERDGIEVEFGIHPVAGRMPGHMNVLLAEESIDYEKLREMEQINSTLPQTDVAIVVGANDTVNPTARQSSGSPIDGMPIIDADAAHTVVVIKRSLSPGFAGIANPLFAADNALMLFGDGRAMIEELANAYHEL